MSGLPANRGTKKFDLINRFKGGSTGGNVDVKIFTNVNDLVNRMSGIIAAMKAGNTNVSLKNELRQIIDILLSKQVIKPDEHRFITNQFRL